MPDGTLHLQFPEAAEPLFGAHRYIVLRGGRASMKSWSVGRALVLRGWQGPLRWLCAREFQSSIRESVHHLLASQIQLLGLSDAYRIEERAIYGRKHATEFNFAGLSDLTAESIKSYEGYDGAWVEEARVLTDRSLNILLPTIRKAGSQIIFTYNPELDTDPIHQFANGLTPEEGAVIDLNWRDNPWFGPELEQERARAQRTMPKAQYQNIWEGKCLPAAVGAIYADEIAQMQVEKRFGDYPYEAQQLVHPVFDLGWNDHMAIGLWQRHISQLRCVHYLEDSHRTLAHYSAELRKLPHNYGKLFLPHDGRQKDYRSGQSAQEILEGLGWSVVVLPQQSVAEGINVCRMAMHQMFIDKPHAGRLVECLRRYRRGVPKTTGEPGDPIHDEYSHGADMTRYAAIAAPQMNDPSGGLKLPPINYPKRKVV